MEEDQLNIDETTLSVDLSEATDAVKEGSFEHALSLLKIILKDEIFLTLQEPQSYPRI